jgi:TM2 domain-containing membrane protein YozV
MSDEKNLGDDLNDMLGDAKENAKEFAGEAKEKASEFADNAKEAAKEFSENAKETLNNVSTENKKVLAGVLGILLGSLGVHKFILGYNQEGTILLGITIIGWVLSCIGIGIFIVWFTGLIGLIEGIIYLTKSDEEFHNTYQVGKKAWF